MPVFHEHNVIFVHIPKTAGTTINNVFGLRKLFPISRSLLEYDISIMYGNTSEYELDHLTSSDIKKLLYDNSLHNVWDCYVKMAVVRNPFDRLVSQYHYCKENKDFRVIGDNPSNWNTFDDFILRLNQVWKTIDVISHTEKSHYISQYDFLYDNSNNLIVDYVLRFENLTDDMYEFCRLNGTKIPLEKMKEKTMTSTHEHYTHYLTNSETISIIQKLYKKDFTELGYSFHSSSA